ncbi:MAG: Myo-inositol 2-dehydrogenase [Verrucomicrobiales bacterium]|nr:Myo-inositol 2-dehydrogenase [Verrucomicrobiales bacterium]
MTHPMKFLRKMTLLGFALALLMTNCKTAGPHQENPLSLNSKNPHYFDFLGKPTLLITSGEHYGAVLNADFNFIPYLDELKRADLNLTRTFTGFYVEKKGNFGIGNNVLAPDSGKFICPWARSTQPGYAGGGNKFDLAKWDPVYFSRLKKFVAEASDRGIVVELNLFCPFYDDTQWAVAPVNPNNNINGTPEISRTNVYTLDKNKGLLEIQKAMTEKIVRELNEFDNVYYEICNEPYFGGVTLEWQKAIASVIRAAERGLPHQHLISQNIANGSRKISDPDPQVSIFNFHYATPPVTVGMNYSLEKVLGDNETGFKGTNDFTYRSEGWAFLLAGGGLYNNLDYSFAVGHESGDLKYSAKEPGGGSRALRDQLTILKRFMFSLDFVDMAPFALPVSGLPSTAAVYCLKGVTSNYAVYLKANGIKALTIRIPAKKWTCRFVDTKTGKISESQGTGLGGEITLALPRYSEDIAFELRTSQ